MNFREFEAEIRKNEVEGAKPLYDLGNFFIRYYLSKTRFWIAVVVVDRGIVKGCIVVSIFTSKNIRTTINTAPIKSFSEIMGKHMAPGLNQGIAMHISDSSAEALAKMGARDLFKELKIIELPKITRKGKERGDRLALPNPELTERVAKQRAKILCPNCEKVYLHFKGKVEGKVIIGCKHCEISYYKKL